MYRVKLNMTRSFLLLGTQHSMESGFKYNTTCESEEGGPGMRSHMIEFSLVPDTSVNSKILSVTLTFPSTLDERELVRFTIALPSESASFCFAPTILLMMILLLMADLPG